MLIAILRFTGGGADLDCFLELTGSAETLLLLTFFAAPLVDVRVTLFALAVVLTAFFAGAFFLVTFFLLAFLTPFDGTVFLFDDLVDFLLDDFFLDVDLACFLADFFLLPLLVILLRFLLTAFRAVFLRLLLVAFFADVFLRAAMLSVLASDP